MNSETALRMRILGIELARHYYRFGDEASLQDGIAEILKDGFVTFEREFIFDTKNRFDFWLPEGIAIEVKVKDSISDALLQADRYLRLDGVKGVLLATTCGWGRTAVIPESYNKKLQIAYLRRSAL